jgi:hypothetical protein
MLIAVVATCVAVPASALGGTSADADCNKHQALTSHYTVKQLQQALATMPADEEEYTNCQDVIQRQLNQELATPGSGSTGSSGGSGGSFLPAWAIVLLIVVILGGTSATVVARRRRTDGDAPPSED